MEQDALRRLKKGWSSVKVDNYVQLQMLAFIQQVALHLARTEKKILLLNDIKQKINRKHQKLSISSDN